MLCGPTRPNAKPLTSADAMEEQIIGIKRTIIIPVMLALGTVASTVTVSAAPAASSAPVVAVASHVRPQFTYDG